MGELSEPFPRLPRNIRQMGDRDQVLKLYVEDYVNTYLKRLRPAKGSELRVGLLLGSRESHEDMPYVFVDGALEMEAVTHDGEKVTFTEDAWKKAYKEVEQMFPRRTVQGWFLCGSPGCVLSPLNYWHQHNQYFNGKNQLMYLSCGLEGEEAIYITSSDGFYRLRGYSIYYERNQMMQDYMIMKKDTPGMESGANDQVIRNFRQKMEENQKEAVRHRSTVGTLSGLCTVLTIAVLAGGVAMFNNYRKMHEMESVIASVMPEGSIKDSLLFSKSRSQEDKLSPNAGKLSSSEPPESFRIEEASGNIFMSQAPETKEYPSEVIPETMPPVQTEQAASGEALSDGREGTDPAAPAAGKAQEQPVNETSAAGGSAETEASESGTREQLPLAESAQTVSAANYRVYEVSDGETLFGICYKLYSNLDHLNEICRVNSLTDQNSIYAGQKLLVP